MKLIAGQLGDRYPTYKGPKGADAGWTTTVVPLTEDGIGNTLWIGVLNDTLRPAAGKAQRTSRGNKVAAIDLSAARMIEGGTGRALFKLPFDWSGRCPFRRAASLSFKRGFCDIARVCIQLEEFRGYRLIQSLICVSELRFQVS